MQGGEGAWDVNAGGYPLSRRAARGNSLFTWGFLRYKYPLRENARHAALNERRHGKIIKFSYGGKWLEDDNVYMNSLLQQAHSGRQDYPSGQERAVTLRTAHRVTDHEDVPVRFSSSAPHTLEKA